MTVRRTLGCCFTLLLLLMPIISSSAQIPLSEYERALYAIPVSNASFILSTIELAMSQVDFPGDSLLRLIDRLAAQPGAAYEKEAIVMILAHAMEDGLPIEGLINRASEGLARGVSLQQIEAALSQRLILLAETRDLLYSKGIFSAAIGAPQSVPTAIPMPRFNQLLIHISGTIGEFLEAGGSPFEGHVIYQEVHNRLTMLQGVSFTAEDVELVLDRIEPSDLTQVALAAVS